MNNSCQYSGLQLFISVIFALSILSITIPANAALVSRLNGAAVYDTDLDITWTANANINGAMNWDAANTWAANLVLGGYSGWRLPSTTQLDPTCSGQYLGIFSYGYNCTGGELGHLFYNELGGVAGHNITTTHNANYSFFSNFMNSNYWTGTEFVAEFNYARIFDFYDGVQAAAGKNTLSYALAVRSGDVGVVPVPTTIWLFGSGLMGLFGFFQRHQV